MSDGITDALRGMRAAALEREYEFKLLQRIVLEKYGRAALDEIMDEFVTRINREALN